VYQSGTFQIVEKSFKFNYFVSLLGEIMEEIGRIALKGNKLSECCTIENILHTGGRIALSAKLGMQVNQFLDSRWSLPSRKRGRK
jgi:hypothetical protein